MTQREESSVSSIAAAEHYTHCARCQQNSPFHPQCYEGKRLHELAQTTTKYPNLKVALNIKSDERFRDIITHLYDATRESKWGMVLYNLLTRFLLTVELSHNERPGRSYLLLTFGLHNEQPQSMTVYEHEWEKFPPLWRQLIPFHAPFHQSMLSPVFEDCMIVQDRDVLKGHRGSEFTESGPRVQAPIHVTNPMTPTSIRVVAALISTIEPKYLVGQRPKGTTRGGKWEFPGGKLKAGETDQEALMRELEEECGIRIAVADQELASTQHVYTDMTVDLHVYTATIIEGTPRPIYHDELRWCTWSEVEALDLLPPNRKVIEDLTSSEAHVPWEKRKPSP